MGVLEKMSKKLTSFPVERRAIAGVAFEHEDLGVGVIHDADLDLAKIEHGNGTLVVDHETARALGEVFVDYMNWLLDEEQE